MDRQPIDSGIKCIWNNVRSRAVNCLCAHKKTILVFINKHQNNTQVSAYTVFHDATYLVSLTFTQHNESINDNKNDDLHTLTPCLIRSVYVLLMTSQSIACDPSAWKVISNLLDIDFIQGDIHGQSCKKGKYLSISRHINLYSEQRHCDNLHHGTQ